MNLRVGLTILIVQFHLSWPVECTNLRNESVINNEIKKRDKEYKMVCYLVSF